MDTENHNRFAWDYLAQTHDPFTLPVSPAQVAAARKGDFQIYLSPTRPAPHVWFQDLGSKDVLCLAGGGGQQGPILAAAGANVTVLDLSPEQLAQDRFVAQREQLSMTTIAGSMTDLSIFEDGSYDLIVNPVSNLFVENVWPVWVEAFRVLRPGGILIAGFMNPAFYIFDRQLMDDQDILQVRHAIPYSDIKSLTQDELSEIQAMNWPLEFGHSLEDQIGAQISVGFSINGFYEDRDPRCILSNYISTYLITRALKPSLTVARLK